MPFDKTAEPHRVVALAYDQLWPFEFGVAAEIFGWARPEIDLPWYDFSVAAVERRIRSMGGVSMAAAHGLERLEAADTIIVPGWRDVREPGPPALAEGLRRAADRGARLVSYCTGAFVFAHAGLLSGRRATTHWRHLQAFRDLFPDIEVLEDVIYVEDGGLITSAGSSAAVDVSLHLIREDHGAHVANKVARSLVTPPHRDGGQSQYAEAPVQERPGKSVAGVLEWARERLSEPISIAAMAETSGMSERTFLRRFREGAGTTPLKWLRRERVFRAMRLLEETRIDPSDISVQCGFKSDETFRTAFKAVAGVSPAAYRKRFQAPEPRLAGR